MNRSPTPQNPPRRTNCNQTDHHYDLYLTTVVAAQVTARFLLSQGYIIDSHDIGPLRLPYIEQEDPENPPAATPTPTALTPATPADGLAGAPIAASTATLLTADNGSHNVNVTGAERSPIVMASAEELHSVIAAAAAAAAGSSLAAAGLPSVETLQLTASCDIELDAVSDLGSRLVSSSHHALPSRPSRTPSFRAHHTLFGRHGHRHHNRGHQPAGGGGGGGGSLHTKSQNQYGHQHSRHHHGHCHAKHDLSVTSVVGDLSAPTLRHTFRNMSSGGQRPPLMPRSHDHADSSLQHHNPSSSPRTLMIDVFCMLSKPSRSCWSRSPRPCGVAVFDVTRSSDLALHSLAVDAPRIHTSLNRCLSQLILMEKRITAVSALGYKVTEIGFVSPSFDHLTPKIRADALDRAIKQFAKHAPRCQRLHNKGHCHLLALHGLNTIRFPSSA